MAGRDITDYLQDIINHSKDAVEFTEGISFEGTATVDIPKLLKDIKELV